MDSQKKFTLFITILISIMFIGTFGYRLLLDVPFVDAFYMTVITISTVGYTEVAQMSPEAKLFSVFIIFISLGTVGYLFSSIVSSFMEGDIKEAFRRRFMEKREFDTYIVK